MNNTLSTLLFFFGVFCLCLPQAHAHRVSIYAYAKDGRIYTESGFGKNRPVVQGTIEVRNAEDNSLLFKGETNPAGLFDFPIDESMRSNQIDLKLTVIAGEGHAGEWIITAEEYLPSVNPQADESTETAPSSDPAPATAEPVAGQPAAEPDVLKNVVREVVAEELDRQLAPLRRSLAAMENPEPTVRDVVGGVGWILGLFGAAALASNRRKKN